jgi:hypothetical protein
MLLSMVLPCIRVILAVRSRFKLMTPGFGNSILFQLRVGPKTRMIDQYFNIYHLAQIYSDRARCLARIRHRTLSAG